MMNAVDSLMMEEGLSSPRVQVLIREPSRDHHVVHTLTTPIPLYSYHEIPSYLKGNPYITCGYRADVSLPLCFKR
jgi:hypothetical protein